MRSTDNAVKINRAVERIISVLKEENLSEEEIADALKAAEVTLGVKPPMPPHRPPMCPKDMPPHRPPMRPDDMPPGRMMV